MVAKKDIEIVSIKRIVKKDSQGVNRFYNRAIYKKDDKKSSYDFHYIKGEPLDKKILRGKEKIVYRENEIRNDHQLYKKRNQIAKKSTKSQKVKGFYFSSIQMSLIVRYKNQTPFHFPTKGKTNAVTRARNLTESQMIQSVLYGEELEQFKYWYELSKENKGVYIYGGWTYKRVFSKTGSFNGDTLFLDYIQREFQGNSGVLTHNKLKKYRKSDVEKQIRL